jgi:Protein of unknown function (DUF3108)
MKKLAAVLGAFALASLAGPAGAQPAAAQRFEAVYSVVASMGNVGDFSYSFAAADGRYQASAERRVTGIFRMLVRDSQDFTYSASGVVADDGALQPAAYQHSGGKRNRIVRARFSPSDVVTTTDPPGMSMGNPAATAAQKRGVVDQLTAIAAMATAEDDPCGKSIGVYMDGRSRFDFQASPNGRVNVNTRAYRGEAIRCRVQFRPIAGFSDPQGAAELTFLFVQTPSGLFAPIRIQMPTNDVGVVTLEAKSFSVNGQPLR